MSLLKDIAGAASQIITFAVPLIRVTQPGSPAALVLAEALETAGKYLKFADKMADEHLTELAADFAAIKADVEAMAEAGDHVPPEKWEAAGAKIKSAADRIRAATGQG